MASTPKKKIGIHDVFHILVFIAFITVSHAAGNADDLFLDIAQTIEVVVQNDTPDDVISLPEKKYCMTEECVRIAASLINSIDRSVDPCEDFYDFVCGQLIEDNPVSVNDQRSDRQVFETANRFFLKKLLERPINGMESDAEKKAKIYYGSCKNFNFNLSDPDTLNVRAINDLIAKVGGWSFNENFDTATWSLQTTMENIERNGKVLGNGLFRWTYNTDPKAPCELKIFTPFNYLNLGNTTDDMGTWLSVMTQVGTNLGGERNATESSMRRVIKFGEELAKITRFEIDSTPVANLAHFDNAISFMNWTGYYRNIFSTANKTVDGKMSAWIWPYQYWVELNELVRKYTNSSEGKKTLNDYLIWQILPTLQFKNPQRPPKKIYWQSRHIRSTSDEESDNWNDCMTETMDKMRYAINAMLGVDNQTRLMINQMINATREGFLEELKNLDWVDDRSRINIEAVANRVKYQIGHTEFVDDPIGLDQHYMSLDFVDGDYLINSPRLKQFLLRDNELGSEFNSTLLANQFPTVNPIFSRNHILVPNGILRKPFIGLDRPKYINYGYLGCAIGHEFIHALHSLDQMGINSSSSFNSSFLTRSECFEKQYNDYNVNGVKIDGSKTLREDIADNGGVRAAYRAYLKSSDISHESGLLPGLDFTDKQLFFISFARNRCNVVGREMQRVLLDRGSHSPKKYRVLGPLSNFEEFSKVFKCSNKSRMNPEKKCKLW